MILPMFDGHGRTRRLRIGFDSGPLAVGGAVRERLWALRLDRLVPELLLGRALGLGAGALVGDQLQG